MFFYDEQDEAMTDVQNETSQTNTIDQGTMQLHQEELDISKSRIQTGEVILSKGIVEEQKSVDVPVFHEEVVIKTRMLNNERSDASINAEETIRIPVTEEQVQINKHTVVTEEISAYKREVAETKHIEETLRKEEAYIETDGHPHVIKDEMSSDITQR